MEQIPLNKKVIEIAIYVSTPNNADASSGHKIMLIADKTTSLGDVMAIAVDAVKRATGPASGV